MARKRSLDPDLWTDDKVCALRDVRAVLFYIGSLSQADDYGRLEWSPLQLQVKLFANREDVELADVIRWMDELVEVRLVLPYTANGRAYILHPQWSRHQYISRPSRSKIPPPPPELSEQCADFVRTDSVQATDAPRTHHAPSDTELDTDTGMDYASLRSAAIGAFPTFPEDVEGLGGLALIFVHRFANCADPGKAKKHLPDYIGMLNVMRERGLTIAQAWKAFEDAWKANGGRPLFAALAKKASYYLPGHVANRVQRGSSSQIREISEADL